MRNSLDLPRHVDKKLSWSYGRQLTGVCGYARDENGAVITDEEDNLSFSETPAITYTYTNDGNQLTKTVDGVTTRYTLNGSQILREKTGDETLNYYYDGEEKLRSIGYVNGTSTEVLYTVARNAQGDIVALYTSVNAAAPTLVGTYSYDVWGKITAVTPASETSDPNRMLQKNPFRYRGYYYDEETGWYYLASRYYDVTLWRFLNCDTQIDTENFLGFNLYAYALNRPIVAVDPSGKATKSIDLLYELVQLLDYITCTFGHFNYLTYWRSWNSWNDMYIFGGEAAREYFGKY